MCINFSTRSRNKSNIIIILSKITSIGGAIAITSALYYFEPKSEFLINLLSYVVIALLSYVLIILILRYFIRRQSNPDVPTIINFPFAIILALMFPLSIPLANSSLEYVPYFVVLLYVIVIHYFNYWYILSNMFINSTFISTHDNQVKISVYQPIFFRFLFSQSERNYNFTNGELNLSIHRFYSFFRVGGSIIFQTNWKEYLSRVEPQKISLKDFQLLQNRVKSSKVIDQALYNVYLRTKTNDEEEVIPLLFNIDVNELVYSIEKLESKYTVSL